MAATKKAPAKKATPKKAVAKKAASAKKTETKKVAAKKTVPKPTFAKEQPTSNESRIPVTNFKYGMGDLKHLEQAIADGKNVTLRIDSGPQEVVITGM